jgi:hypothetical protein
MNAFSIPRAIIIFARRVRFGLEVFWQRTEILLLNGKASGNAAAWSVKGGTRSD